MRTTVVLDDQLVKEAREVLGGESLGSMIETSLREAIAARRRGALVRAIDTGSMELAITEEELVRMRKDKPLELDAGGEEA
jgi:hypothetical protein